MRTGCVSQVSDAYRMRTGCVPDAYQMRTGCVPDAYRMRTGCVPDAYRMRTRCVPDAYRMRIRRVSDLVRIRYASGTHPVRIWYASGTHPVRILYASGTQCAYRIRVHVPDKYQLATHPVRTEQFADACECSPPEVSRMTVVKDRVTRICTGHLVRLLSGL